VIEAGSYLLYECPECDGLVVIEGEYGFMPGHDVCVVCSYDKHGRYQGAVQLRFLGAQRNPVKLTRGQAREDLASLALSP
jgi:hypothetical protein